MICWAIMAITSSATAQSALSQRIDFEAKNALISEALLQLSRASGVAIGFSDYMLDAKKRVQIMLKNEPVSVILDKVLEGSGIGWRAASGQVLLYKLPPPEQTLSGFIQDATSGERLVGAMVSELHSGRFATTNAYGFFSLRVPHGSAVFLVTSMLGFQPVRTLLSAATAQRQVTIALQPAITTMQAIEVSSDSLDAQSKPFFAKKEENIARLPIFQMPALGGEADLMRAAALLPGIESSSDGLGGWSVRGGETDQNLVLIDDAVVFNPVHGMGLFSAFNPDIVRSARLWKGDAPARIGGGASSAWDVRTKEGNMQRPAGALSLGWLAGRLSLEVPFNEKGAMLFSARRSMAGPVIRHFAQKENARNDEQTNTHFYFYDLNWKGNWTFNNRNRVYISLYDGYDSLKDDKVNTFMEQDTFDGMPVPFNIKFTSENRCRWNNRFASLRWNHLFSDRFFSNTTVTASRFFIKSSNTEKAEVPDLPVPPDSDEYNTISQTKLYDYSLKTDWDWYYSNKLILSGGAQVSVMRILPFYYAGNSDFFPPWMDYDENGMLTFGAGIAYETGYLNALYGESEWMPAPNWRIRTGLRTDFFHNRGKTWIMPQPRITVEKKWANGLTLMTTLNRTAQMLRSISPNVIESTSDFWLMAGPTMPPQHNWQLTTGLGWTRNNWSFRVEAYAKKLNNIEEYLIRSYNFDSIFIFDSIEYDLNGFRAWDKEIAVGQGKAYGLELLLEKKHGRTTAWVAWTLSRSRRQFAHLNDQQWFPARLDRLQNLKIAVLHQLNRHISLAANWQIASGDAVSKLLIFPKNPSVQQRLLDFYKIGLQADRKGYGDYRQAQQHRLDLSINGQWKLGKLEHHVALGCYNAYSRANTYYTFWVFDINEVRENKEQIRGLPFLPHLNWSVKF